MTLLMVCEMRHGICTLDTLVDIVLRHGWLFVDAGTVQCNVINFIPKYLR